MMQVAGKAIAGEEEDPTLNRAASHQQASTSATASAPSATPAAQPAQHSLSAPSRLHAHPRRQRTPQASLVVTQTASAVAAPGEYACAADIHSTARSVVEC